MIKSKPEKNESLNQVIAAVKADGILTPKEEKLVREVAKAEGKDGDLIVALIKQELEASEEDSETELIDVNAKAGYDFEKFVVRKFNKRYFGIRNWAGDKFVEGRYANTTTQPDIQERKWIRISFLTTQYKFEVEHDEDFSFCMFTEQDSPMEFIEGFRIKNRDDLEKLGYNNIWIRYLNRGADMEVTEMEMEEMPICFRLHKMRTLVFCASSHYYDEVYEHLTLPEDFIGYFHKNKKNLWIAWDNRFKF